ncbi:hypothetical protein [Pedobacter frigiditerrae]|uniref:hypothetical protein n=1 Tax=Pedobacter frigiditerrae TaxID=2530452 RepID=UPI00197E04A4|nr:hypothetical protein [Pedobacter frigiditerrae]
MKIIYTALLSLLSAGVFAQSNVYPTTGTPIIYDYSPGLTLQRNTASGGYTQGIQTKLQNGDNNWFFGNLHDGQWIVSKGDHQFPRFTVEANGHIGIGTTYSRSKLNINSSGSDLNGGNVDIDANALVLQATIGSRSTTIGPKIEFAMPVNSDGTNPWSLARLMTVAGNSSPGDATGKMVLGTRRYYNKLGAGSQWYFGDDLVIDGGGNVGVGTLNPRAKIDVATYINDGVLGSVLGRLVEGDDTGSGTFVGLRGFGTQSALNGKSFAIEHSFYGETNSSISFYRGNSRTGGYLTFSTNSNYETMRIDPNGNVGIGTTTPNEKLAVNGKIRAKEIKVEPNPATWPDYVFESDYKVGTLEELESYVKINKHLPEMPTAKEVAANGLELGEMNKLLLKKVEELTLHLIEKDKQLQDSDKRLTSLEEESKTMKELLKIIQLKLSKP